MPAGDESGPRPREERRPTRRSTRVPDQLSLLELVNRTIDRGVVLHGELTLSIADIDLVELRLDLRLASVEPEPPPSADDDDDDE